MAIVPNIPYLWSPDTGPPTLGLSQTDERIFVRPQAYVDSPQVMLTEWINKCGGPMEPLGSVPSGLRVGIIGGGSAGLTAALEAVKAGAITTLIEARSEVGGRARSVKMGPIDIAELGSMRFPPSEATLYTLAEAFGYCFINKFPDPGHVPTLIRYKEERPQVWDDTSIIPHGFETVTNGWRALIHKGCVINGKEFSSLRTMGGWLQSPDIETRMKTQEKWQQYIDEFKSDTFRHGLEKIFGTSNNTPPAGKHWGDEEFNRFGSLGIGSGGLGAYYNAGFLTVVRCVPNCWDIEQAMFATPVDAKNGKPAGIRALWQTIWEWATEHGLTTLLDTKATAVSKSGDSIYTVTVETPDGGVKQLEFDELFINVTTNVANEDLDLARIGAGQIFREATCEAIKSVHMALSTKLFIRVKRTPYFDNPKFPRVLLTDGELPQLYCLDYEDNDTLVVLVVYAWEDYSARLAAEKDPEKLFKYLKELARRAVSNSEDYKHWAECLEPDPSGDVKLIHWQDDLTTRGAFTCALPDQDRLFAALFYDFFEKEEGPYLIGDSASFGGGWTEPALETAYNCISAMLKRRGQLIHPELAPVNLLNPSTYKY